MGTPGTDRPDPLPLPYQQRYLSDPSRLTLWVKSRRVGGSWAVALKAAFRAAGVVPDARGRWRYRPERGVSQQIISSSHERSIDLLAEVAGHLEFIGRRAKKKLVSRETKTVLELANGAVCTALAPNPRTVRGGEGDVTFDEFGAMPHSEKIWAAAAPMADRNLGHPEGYKISIVGTPLGDDNRFYRLARTDAGAAFSRHHTTIHEAIADGFPADIDECRAVAGDGDTFEQEYNCSFLSASLRYISADLYDACLFDLEDRPAGLGIGYAGYDIATKPGGDLAAIVELRRLATILWHDRTEVRRGASWDDQEAWVAEVLRRCTRIAADSTGMGSAHADRLEKRHGITRFEPFDFTQQSKELLATGLRLAMERHRLKLRREDVDLRRDVLSLRREITKAGNVRFDAERVKDGKGYTHADRAWALALAVHAAGKPVGKSAGSTPGGGSETDRVAGVF